MGPYAPLRVCVSVCVSVQVCDSDTVLDPACTIEMLKILEEDPQVGAVGGDVQVSDSEQPHTASFVVDCQFF